MDVGGQKNKHLAGVAMRKTKAARLSQPPASPMLEDQIFFISKIKWFLKLQFDQNSIIINYKPNGNFKSHIIFGRTQEGLVALLHLQGMVRTLGDYHSHDHHLSQSVLW